MSQTTMSQTVGQTMGQTVDTYPISASSRLPRTNRTTSAAMATQVKPRPKSKSKVFRELNAVVAIIARDVIQAFKSPAFLIMSLAMPIVMMGMLGGSIGQNLAGGLGYNYMQFMMVGMIVNMLFMMTAQGLASLVEDHQTNFTQDMLVSPISRYSIVVGKIFGSSFAALAGVFGALIVGLVMGIPITLGQVLLVLALSPLMCLSGGAIAMIIMGTIRNTKMANLAVMLVVMPQMFLSGIIIPIAQSSGILYVISRILPMTYCADLMRAVFYAGTPEYSEVVIFNPLLSLTVVIALIVVCLVIGTFLYARAEKSK